MNLINSIQSDGRLFAEAVISIIGAQFVILVLQRPRMALLDTKDYSLFTSVDLLISSRLPRNYNAGRYLRWYLLLFVDW